MRLLLVEDNAELAENLQEIFTDLGHDVTLAGSGARALEAAAAPDAFDLALVDLRLPDMSGMAILPRFKTLLPDAEVIVTTGNADLESAIEAVRTGAFAYLVKPVAPRELHLTVDRALERVQLRRQARALQEELQRSEQRYRDMVETAQVLVVAIDNRARVQFVNRALEETTGYARDELVGRDVVELLVPAAGHQDMRALIQRAVDGQRPEREVELAARDGSLRRVQLRWTRADAEGALFYGIGLDVTRQRELERAARVSEKLAAVGTMTAGLAHEIRNPLNAALLQLALLERRIGKVVTTDREALNQPMQLVRAELSRLASLVEDFLAFARPREVGNFPVDYTTLVREVVELQEQVAQSLQKKLSADVANNVWVAGEGNTLKGAVVNLVRNALEASRSNVQVRLAQEQDRAVLTIQDDGPGIPLEVQKHLFEPFYSTKESGTGLGLAIVYTAVVAHGGDISLSNGEGGGALARVDIPLIPAPG